MAFTPGRKSCAGPRDQPARNANCFRIIPGNMKAVRTMEENKRGTILLLQPQVGYMDSARSSPSLPLGLLHASVFAARRHRIIIFDQRLHTDWRSKLADIVREQEPILTGTTMFIGPSVTNALEMLSVVRGATAVPVVAGGVLPSLAPRMCLEDPEGRIDYVAEGEGENVLSELADRLAAGDDPCGVPGLWYKDGGDVRSTPPAPQLDLDSLPEIPYDLVPVGEYMPAYSGRKTLFMESSRGCPMKCSYCFNQKFNRGVWRAQSADRVVSRIKHVRDRFGAGEIYFVDDNFFIDLERGMKIAGALAELGVKWQVQGIGFSSLRRMSGEQLGFLRDSGLQRISIGVESGSPGVRKLLGKKYTNDELREKITELRDYGFVVFCSFMCDIPTETREDIRRSVSLALDLIEANPNFRTSPFYRYAPAPGTRLFDIAVEEGRSVPGSIVEWGRVSFDSNKYGRGRDNYFFRGLYVATLFCDRKSDDYSASKLFRMIAALYRPVARFRLKRMFFRLMPESSLFFRWLDRNK